MTSAPCGFAVYRYKRALLLSTSTALGRSRRPARCFTARRGLGRRPFSRRLALRISDLPHLCGSDGSAGRDMCIELGLRNRHDAPDRFGIVEQGTANNGLYDPKLAPRGTFILLTGSTGQAHVGASRR